MTHHILTYSEAAHHLRVSVRTLRRRVREHRIPTIRLGGVRFLRSDLDHYLNQLRVGLPDRSLSARDRGLVEKHLGVDLL